MNKIIWCIFLAISTFFCQAQNDLLEEKNELEVDYFYGNIVEHNTDIGHLITGHPEGFLITYNRKTYGKEEWERHYNFPDYGASFMYQDMKNTYLGKHIGAYIHYNFYFLNRHLMFRVAQGISYNPNPYDAITNYENIAYGTHILTSTYLLLNYKKENLLQGLGIHGGISVTHYSNGNFKAPNKSTNTFAVNVGVNYLFEAEEKKVYAEEKEVLSYSEPLHLNFIFRGGLQTSDVIGMKQFPFYVLGTYLDKRVSFKSSVQLGSEVFLSPMLREYIDYRSIAYPEDDITGEEASTRIGVFAGYQLHLGKTSIVGNLGYYAYYPYNFEGRVYLRASLQREVFNSFFVNASVKSHAAKAEAIEFGIGYRL